MDRGFSSLKKTIAKNVKLARNAVRISQEELAFRADVDRSYVSQIERAVGNPSLLILYKLGKALEIAPGDLLSQRATVSGERGLGRGGVPLSNRDR